MGRSSSAPLTCLTGAYGRGTVRPMENSEELERKWPRGRNPVSKKWASGQRVDAHPNSLEARSATDPALQKRISEGRRKADQDLHSMNTWAVKGCSVGMQSHPGDFEDRLYV